MLAWLFGTTLLPDLSGTTSPIATGCEPGPEPLPDAGSALPAEPAALADGGYADEQAAGSRAAPDASPSAVAPEPPAPTGAIDVRLGETPSGAPVDWAVSIKSNPHLMLVGLPGMGKTTALINICQQLAGN